MNQKQLNIAFLLGLCIYNMLFWQEKMGLNVLLFTLFVSAILFYTHPNSFRQKTVQVTGLGTLVLAFAVIFVNSALCKVIFCLSMLSFAGFVQQVDLRFLGYGLFSKVINFFYVPRILKQRFGNRIITKGQVKGFKYYLKLIVFPILFFIVFFTLYSAGNPRLSQFLDNILAQLDRVLFRGASFISFSWICFLLAGIILLGGLIFKPYLPFFSPSQANKEETLIRTRRKHVFWSMLALKKEYFIGLTTFISLNILLFIVNVLDIQLVWFQFEPLSAPELSRFVHEGTYVLIFSILLAMSLVMYFFNNNLNFYPKNKALKIAVYTWITQNTLLALSVGVRNFHYIKHYGLAYKRIGVVIFLLLVVGALFFLAAKVRNRKSAYYFFHRNAWVLYVVLLLASLVNWDGIIVKHNLNQAPHRIDKKFLVTKTSDKTLPQLLEFIPSGDKQFFHYNLHVKRFEFMDNQSNYSFWSWNYPDYKTMSYLKDRGLDNMNH